jgi:hypothetical protein
MTAIGDEDEKIYRYFMGCGALLVVGIFAGAVLGFIGYRNMYPSPSGEDVPEIAGRFNKDKLAYASGNPFGTTKMFTTEYSSDKGGKKATLLYLLNIYADENSAIRLMDRLPCDYEVKKGMVKDKAGKEIGIYRVCGLSNPTLQMTNDFRSLAVMSNTDKSPISLSDIENFVTSLSFNSNVDFADLNIGFADVGVADRTK